MCRDGEGHFPSWSGLALMLHTWGCDAVLLGWCAVESFGVGLLRDRKHLAHRVPILKSSKAKNCPTVTVYHMYLKTLRYKTLTLQYAVAVVSAVGRARGCGGKHSVTEVGKHSIDNSHRLALR